MKDYLQVGAVTSTHGLRGEVKVFPTTDDPGRYDDLKQVWVNQGGEMRPLTVERVKYFKQFVIVKFQGLDTIEAAEPYVKKELYVARANAVSLGDNEYFIADLIGMEVQDEEGNILGHISEVLSTGANDVYVVAGGSREILIPAISQCILAVDVAGGSMKVHLLEGL